MPAHRVYEETVNMGRKARHRFYALIRKNTQRARIIELLGGKCVRCGFSDSRALQVDHVNGGGCSEKDSRWAEFLIKRIIEDVKNKTNLYQLLCANCNWIKRYEKGEHGGSPAHKVTV